MNKNGLIIVLQFYGFLAYAFLAMYLSLVFSPLFSLYMIFLPIILGFTYALYLMGSEK